MAGSQCRSCLGEIWCKGDVQQPTTTTTTKRRPRPLCTPSMMSYVHITQHAARAARSAHPPPPRATRHGPRHGSKQQGGCLLIAVRTSHHLHPPPRTTARPRTWRGVPDPLSGCRCHQVYPMMPRVPCPVSRGRLALGAWATWAELGARGASSLWKPVEVEALQRQGALHTPYSIVYP